MARRRKVNASEPTPEEILAIERRWAEVRAGKEAQRLQRQLYALDHWTTSLPWLGTIVPVCPEPPPSEQLELHDKYEQPHCDHPPWWEQIGEG